MELISDLMTRNVTTVRGSETLEECGRKLLDEGCRHLPVVDDKGTLLGMAHDFDVFAQGVFTGVTHEWVRLDPKGPETAREIVRPVDVLAAPDDLLLPAIRQHVESDQDVIVVVEGTKVAGIITEHDGVRLAALMLAPNLEVDHADTWPVHTVKRSEPARKALNFMRANRIRHVPVVEEGLKVWGVLSYRDLIMAGVRGTTTTRADQLVIHRNLHTIRPSAGVREAASVMVHHKIGCLPVVNSRNQIEGIISRIDVLHALIADLEGGELFSGADDLD